MRPSPRRAAHAGAGARAAARPCCASARTFARPTIRCCGWRTRWPAPSRAGARRCWPSWRAPARAPRGGARCTVTDATRASQPRRSSRSPPPRRLHSTNTMPRLRSASAAEAADPRACRAPRARPAVAAARGVRPCRRETARCRPRTTALRHAAGSPAGARDQQHAHHEARAHRARAPSEVRCSGRTASPSRGFDRHVQLLRRCR